MQRGKLGLHRLDDIERRTVPVLENLQQYSALSVRSHNVRLHFEAVVHVGDVPDKGHHAVFHFNRNVVQRVEQAGRIVHLHLVLNISDFRRAAGERQVLRVDRIIDVTRGNSFGLQLRRIQVDHDLPNFAAKRRRQRETVNGGKLLADSEDAVSVEV